MRVGLVRYYTFLWLLLHGIVVQGLTNWPLLDFITEVAIRTQRDISYQIPIDQDTHYGVSLSRLLFDVDGYVESSLVTARSMLDVGVKILTIDLYWNQFTSKWQLCPAPYPINGTSDVDDIQTVHWQGKKYTCQASLTIDKLMQTVYDFFQSTNTNMNVNYLQILYHLHSFHFEEQSSNSTSTSLDKMYYSAKSGYGSVGNSSLSDTVQSLGTHLFTPTDLQSYKNNKNDISGANFYNQSDESFPTLFNFIYTQIKRATVTIIDDGGPGLQDFYNISSGDLDYVFMDKENINVTAVSLSDDKTVGDCLEQVLNQSAITNYEMFNNISLMSHFRYIFDGDGNLTFNNVTFPAMIQCGYSPILNNLEYHFTDEPTDDVGTIINAVIPMSFWSWSQNGDTGLDNSTADEGPQGSGEPLSHEDDRTQEAYKCVALTSDGWSVANCYQPYPYACQNISSPNDWIVQREEKQYFDAHKMGNCPEGYTFGTPSLSIELLALTYAAVKDGVEFPIWIDINDITVTNCFVTNGPYAECPYQRTVSTRALAGLLAPSAVVAVFVLSLVFLENIIRNNPIQSNRKRFWKKRLNEYYEKNDYEGVPS